VQKEFAKERKFLADYIRKDTILGRFFEEVPAQERDAAGLYLNEVAASDIYLGILGNTYGNTNAKGVSATEQEYNDVVKLPRKCRESAEKVPCKCPVNAEKVFKAIQEHPKSSNKDLCVILGLSDRAVRNQIKILKDLNLIVRVGSDKSGYWILSMPDDD
jgi:hypothetical protein